MAKITWLGEDAGDVAGPSFTTWQNMKFDKGKPVDITDLEIINKAKGNQFFKVEGGPGRPLGSVSKAVDVNVEERAEAKDHDYHVGKKSY